MATHEQNFLLSSLSVESAERMTKHLSLVKFPTRADLCMPGDRMTHVYFPINGVVSLTTKVNGSVAEVATVGQEGMVGLAILFGTAIAPLRMFMQIGGDIRVMEADIFADLLNTDPGIRGVMLRYAQAFVMQIGQSVVCNQRHSLRQRCARWLLMTHDRVPGNQFRLTHEFLSVMLGVRRAGVTVAAGALQEAGLIRYRRGLITILDRTGLEDVSCECYQAVANAYRSIVGDVA